MAITKKEALYWFELGMKAEFYGDYDFDGIYEKYTAKEKAPPSSEGEPTSFYETGKDITGCDI